MPIRILSGSLGGAVPGAPTIGTATAGNTQATVTYSAPSYLGKGTPTTYVATSTPGNFTGTATYPNTSIVVSGLSNGTSYTFKVKLLNNYGPSAESAASNAVSPFVPFGFAPFGFIPFSFSPLPVYSFNLTPVYGFTAPWGNSIDVQTKIRTPNGLVYAGDIKVGDVILGLDIPDNFDESSWLEWSQNVDNFNANIAETTVTSVQTHSGSQYVYIDGDLFTTSHYILTQKNNIVEYIKADVIDVTYQRYSYEDGKFVDIQIVEDILVDHNNISIHCEPHDNFFTEQMLVLESLPH